MIKKLLVLSAFFISVVNSVVAQCTPDAGLTSVGFYPASMPDAVVGQSYSQTLQFKLIKDTLIYGLDATITSAVLTDITGKPAGFNYVCNKGGCSYGGGEIGCLTFLGNPASGSEGNYSMVLKLTVSGVLHPSETVVPSYTFDIPISMKIVVSNGLTVTKAPFFALTQREEDLVLLNPANGKLSVSVFDMLGRVVKTANYQSIKGEATYINVAGLEKGIYFVNLQLNGKQETIKISKGFY